MREKKYAKRVEAVQSVCLVFMVLTLIFIAINNLFFALVFIGLSFICSLIILVLTVIEYVIDDFSNINSKH